MTLATRSTAPPLDATRHPPSAPAHRDARSVARRANPTPRAREGAHPRARRAERGATRASRRADREGIPLSDCGGAGAIDRPVRGTASAHRLPLHVLPRVGRGMSRVLVRGGQRAAPQPPPREIHDVRPRLARAAGRAGAVQASHGMEPPVAFVVRLRLQLRLPRHDGRVGVPGRVQLPLEGGARARAARRTT